MLELLYSYSVIKKGQKGIPTSTITQMTHINTKHTTRHMQHNMGAGPWVPSLEI